MTKKVKLSDVARDLQIPTQELIGFYQERDEKGNTKKGVTGLTPEEIIWHWSIIPRKHR